MQGSGFGDWGLVDVSFLQSSPSPKPQTLTLNQISLAGITRYAGDHLHMLTCRSPCAIMPSKMLTPA